MRGRCFVWLGCVLALMATHALAGVSAATDRSTVSVTETFELHIKVDGAMNADEPVLDPLQQDFEILSTSRNHRISLIQGQRESYTEWVVVLLPKRSGALRIPPVTVGSDSTQALDVSVTEDLSTGNTPSGDVSLELTTDASEVHVQQQLLVTVRLMHGVNLASGATLEELEIPGAVVRKIDEGSHEQLVGGRRFGVFERRYAVFPQKSGELELPVLRFRGSTGSDSWFDRFDNNGRQLRLQTASRVLRILPPEQGASPWIPAGNLSIVETWDHSPDSLRAGESATRSITITAEGLTGAQIPPIPDPDLPGLRFYADKPEISDTASATGVTGTRVQRVAVIAQQRGDINLPELRVRWWDTAHNRFDEAVVPARSLRVLPGAGAPSPAAPLTPTGPEPATAATNAAISDAEPTPPALPARAPVAWMTATAASLLLAVFFAIQWMRLRGVARVVETERASLVPEAEKPAFARLETACQAADASGASAALLDWARAAFPEASARSLADLRAITGDQAMGAAVDAMMASRYAVEKSPWDGNTLLSVAARHRPGSGHRQDGKTALPTLYA